MGRYLLRQTQQRTEFYKIKCQNAKVTIKKEENLGFTSSVRKENIFVGVKNEDKFQTNLFYCANCPYKAKRKSSLHIHMRSHFRNARFRCFYCSYSVNYKPSVISHQWIHPEYKPNTIYKCVHCPYQTRIISHLERHKSIHKRILKYEDLPVFKCTHCLFRSFYKSSLERHTLGHERKNGIQCKFCSYTAKTMGGLQFHGKDHAPGINQYEYVNKKFKCTTCAFQTDKRSHYKRHLNTHVSNQNRLKFKCFLCSYKCESKLGLDKHFLTHKTKDGFECFTCAFSTNQLALLKAHVISLHEIKFQAERFSCSNCSYTAIKKSDLIRHAIKHRKPEEIRWFGCSKCPFKAKRKDQLIFHCKRHKLSNGVKCFHCSYRGPSKFGVLRHMKLHQ